MNELSIARVKVHNDRASGLQTKLLILAACIGWLIGGLSGIAWGTGSVALLLILSDLLP